MGKEDATAVNTFDGEQNAVVAFISDAWLWLTSLDPELVLGIANLLVVVAAAVIALQNLRRFRDSRGIDFVVTAEGQIDSLVYGMMTATPQTIRTVFGPRLPDGISDDDLPAFVYSYSSYAHVSRMFYLTNKAGPGLGMSKKDIEEWEGIWLRFLKTQRESEIWLGLHHKAYQGRYFNDNFLEKASQALDYDSKKFSSDENAATNEV